MIESEGITEDVSTWRTDVIAKFINELGMDKVSLSSFCLLMSLGFRVQFINELGMDKVSS